MLLFINWFAILSLFAFSFVLASLWHNWLIDWFTCKWDHGRHWRRSLAYWILLLILWMRCEWGSLLRTHQMHLFHSLDAKEQVTERERKRVYTLYTCYTLATLCVCVCVTYIQNIHTFLCKLRKTYKPNSIQCQTFHPTGRTIHLSVTCFFLLWAHELHARMEKALHSLTHFVCLSHWDKDSNMVTFVIKQKGRKGKTGYRHLQTHFFIFCSCLSFYFSSPLNPFLLILSSIPHPPPPSFPSSFVSFRRFCTLTQHRPWI